jgi:hypothetical protein
VNVFLEFGLILNQIFGVSEFAKVPSSPLAISDGLKDDA